MFGNKLYGTYKPESPILPENHICVGSSVRSHSCFPVSDFRQADGVNVEGVLQRHAPTVSSQ